MNATPLDDLARRITNREAELQKLRREFEERRRHLASLTQRKEALQAQLQRIDTEITALVTGVQRKTAIQRPKPSKSTQSEPAKNAKSKSAKLPVPSRNSATEPGLTLPHLIVRIIQEARGALSISQIAEEALRRGFTTSSGNFRKVVAIRVHELGRKGILRPADGQAGYVLGKSSRIQEAPARKPALPKGNSKNGFPAAGKNSKPSQGKRQGEQPSLQSVLTRILERSTRPLVARDLAKRAVAIGYRSKSKDFDHLVQVTLSRMDGVANMPGKGYRLKKRKG
jgi:hypothetical protein